MWLRPLARNAAMAEAMRQRIRRAGRTPRGQFVWTKKEDYIVKCLYPDYVELQRTLRRRTYYSLRHRARFLDVVKRRHIWKTHEIAYVKRLYLAANTKELFDAFPGMTWHQIAGKARHLGLRGRKPKLKPTGHLLIDAIRTRAMTRGWSMVDIDAVAGTKRYFQKANWHTSGHPDHSAILKAIEVLEGEIAIRWQGSG